MPSTGVVVAGATGWTGRAVAEGVLAAPDLDLTAAVARSAAGSDLATAWAADVARVPIFGSVEEAVDAARPDVLVDYTSPDVVLDNTLTALRHGVRVVIGTSGLTADDFRSIAAMATEHRLGVVAAGNFSLTAAMAQAASLLVAPHLPHREIIDYASADKRDAPSGTARELAERLGELAGSDAAEPIDGSVSRAVARGTTIATTQVHSVRLPSYSVSTEVVFALPDERLVIRHDAGPSAQPYVGGTLLAVRAVMQTTGLVRGLDALLLSRRPGGSGAR
jgi:4-hydroxy-tetrahydrodipicolinate reductase